MPSGQEEPLLQHETYQNPDHKAAILQAVKEQEAQFQQLSRELDAERESVTAHLERDFLKSVSQYIIVHYAILIAYLTQSQIRFSSYFDALSAQVKKKKEKTVAFEMTS
ncbi:uncharacterized protein NPIL_36331 [Nephila pilipes]|uniref:Uncharacterized protein n=1 Tax=Nephila pilipes TaxID=299642 RepID=A0A8X6NC34_NEPPI|nr:uncharacterized protein NPIL_36331 [Nephila pilipes]